MGASLCHTFKGDNSDITARELRVTKLWLMTPVSRENNIH